MLFKTIRRWCKRQRPEMFVAAGRVPMAICHKSRVNVTFLKQERSRAISGDTKSSALKLKNVPKKKPSTIQSEHNSIVSRKPSKASHDDTSDLTTDILTGSLNVKYLLVLKSINKLRRIVSAFIGNINEIQCLLKKCLNFYIVYHRWYPLPRLLAGRYLLHQ